MKRSQLKYLLIAAVSTFTLASCHKDDQNRIAPFETPDMLVLSQGNIGKNNSLVTSYSFTSKTVVTDAFSAVNGRGIGDTGNDIKQYGSKIYIVVNYSSTVEAINAKSLKSVKQIKFENAGVARQTRNIAFYKNNAYVSSYDGTVAVMDTATFEVSKYITVGRNPEQLAVANGKLYVANAGGLSYPDVDNTVSVIDPATASVIKTITVGKDPYAVSVDKYGDVYVLAYGVYYEADSPLNVDPSLTIINSATDAIKSSNVFYGGNFTISGDYAYYLNFDSSVSVYDIKTETTVKPNFITDGTIFTSAYGLAVNDATGEIFIADAKNYTSNGEVVAFSSAGKKEYVLQTGITPSNILFISK